MKCNHHAFDVSANVGRVIADGHDESDPDAPIKRFTVDIEIQCHDCGCKFRFIGLPHGVDLNGAACSADGTEGRFAIAPEGEVVTMVEGLTGFTARRVV